MSPRRPLKDNGGPDRREVLGIAAPVNPNETWKAATCEERDAAIDAAGGRDALYPFRWRTDGTTFSHSELWLGDRPIVADHRTFKEGCWHEVWT